MKTAKWTCLVVALITVLLCGESCFAFADGDVQFWQTVVVGYDINKDWTVTVREHLKLGHSAGNLYIHNTDLGFVYHGLTDWIDLGLNYKVGFSKVDGHWAQENRPHVNITFNGQLGAYEFSDRSRFEFRDKEDQEDLWRYVHQLKVRLPCEFTKFKFRPYFADQLYLNFEGHAFEKNRIYSGVTFELTKNMESELYYAWESRKFDDEWKALNAFGFTFKIFF